VARRHAERVAVSIFVNPTQFGPNEDFAKYPRTLERDVQLLYGAGADYVLAPSVQEVYPEGDKTRVRVSELTEYLCGPFRPGHFEGVATVVAKLFAIAGPCTAVFGRKDYQQLKVIERLARDLLFPVKVVGEPTVRDTDGLALSSRNAYLSPEERARAQAIPRVLAAAAADSDLLLPLHPAVDIGERALIAIAGFCGTTRLIDNLVLGEDAAPVVAPGP